MYVPTASLMQSALKQDTQPHALLTCRRTGTGSESPPTSIDIGGDDLDLGVSNSASTPEDGSQAACAHEDDSSQTYDVGIDDLAELKRAWTGEFVDRDVEHAYRTERLWPNLSVSVSNVLAAVGAVNLLALAWTMEHSPDLWHSTLATAVTSCVFFAGAALFRTSTFCCCLPVWTVECVSTCVLVAMGVFLRFHQLLIPTYACRSNATLMLRLGAYLAFVATSVPLSVPLFALVCVVSTSMAAGLDALHADAAGACPLNIMHLVLLAVAAAGCRGRIARVDRGEWAFRRTVLAAEVERRRLHRQYERTRAKRLKAQHAAAALEAEVAKQHGARHARARLIRMVMHDLRSPLLSCLNVTEQMRELPADMPMGDARVVESVDAMHACSALMENIVSDMLDFERIDTGRLVLVYQPFTLGRLLKDTYATFDGLAKAKGVVIKRAPPDDDLMRTRWLGDKRRLQQCLNNGVSNAIKFTELGGTVAFSAWVVSASADAAQLNEATAELHIAVDDTGVGLSAAELALLSSGEAFTQVGRGQLQGNGGTGLGLSIVRQILQLHNNSELVLSSDGEGRGAHFEMVVNIEMAASHVGGDESSSDLLAAESADGEQIVGLAALAPDADGAPTACAPLRPRADPCAGKALPTGFRVLHVEDDKILQRMLPLSTFKKVGAEWDTAENGERALAMLAERTARGLGGYGLIVMDNQMPCMNGTLATRKMRRMGYDGTIIGMTGDPVGSPERNEFEAAGLNACCDKSSVGIKYIHLLLLGMMVPTPDGAHRAETAVCGGVPILAARHRPAAAAAAALHAH